MVADDGGFDSPTASAGGPPSSPFGESSSFDPAASSGPPSDNPATGQPLPQTDSQPASSATAPAPSPSSEAPPLSAAPTAPVTTSITSVITTISTEAGSIAPATITLTSTSELPLTTPVPSSTTPTAASTSTTSSSTLLPSPTAASDGNEGSSTNGTTIAVAVAVPLVSVALIVFALLFFFRRRKQKKGAEEMRRKEAEEYDYNPNLDPSLPAVSPPSGDGEDNPYEMRQDDTSGYRGWGTTQSGRKLSTTLSNGTAAPIGVAVSDGSPSMVGTATSGPGASPTQPSASETTSGDPLLTGAHRPTTADSETIGELGGAPIAGSKREIHRGISNASSAYSAGNRSDASGEASAPADSRSAPYYTPHDAGSDDDGALRPQPPYDGPYGGGGGGGGSNGQPIIRDVQARRNTRIENPSVYPPPGNAGIAQNF